VARTASKGHGKVGNAVVGERHGKKRVQWATGEVAVRGTRREVVRARRLQRSKGIDSTGTVLSQVELCFICPQFSFFFC
jgi:hypothetical protein